jgi:hypothetical protein
MFQFSTIKKLVSKDKAIKKFKSIKSHLVVKFTVFFTPVSGAGKTETVVTVQEDGTFLLPLYLRFHRKHFCVALVQISAPQTFPHYKLFVCILLCY